MSLAVLLAAPSAAITWEECVREAARSNPRVLASRASAEAARTGIRTARAGYLPTASVSASQSRSGSSGATSDSVSVGPRASWNLFSGFGTEAAVEESMASAEGARAELAGTGASVRAELRRAFGRLLTAQETIKLTEAIASRLRANADFIRLRYEGGVEARWGHLKAEADAKDAAWDLERAGLDLRALQGALVEALGRKEFEAIEAKGELAAPGPEPLEKALSAADQHPAVRSRRESLAAARARVRSASSDRRPSFDVSASYSRSGTDWSVPNSGWSLQGGLSLPIFTGGRDVAEVSQASNRADAARASLEAASNEAVVRIESAYARYRASASRLAVSAAQLEASAERAQTVQALYANGRASFLEWDESQASYTRAQKAELQARQEAYLAMADWEDALGLGLEEGP